MALDLQTLGPYRITRKLGEGAMGAVYQGVQEDTGQVVAIKLLPPSLGAQRGFKERFEAEITTLRKLEHPNIVQCFGYGEENDLNFYVMEYVDGRTLEDEIDDGRRFTWREVVAMGLQICAALKHAHDRGVIHRDLKPANLMLTGAGQIKLADFGIARLYGHSGMTAAGGPIGTATYMSPEQTDGSDVSPRSDLYSLGCVFYALLSGRPPFHADSLQQMLRLQQSAIHEPISSRVGGIPPELDLIINKLLEKKPQDRIPTAATLAKSLASVEDAVKLRESSGNAPAPSLPITGLKPRPAVSKTDATLAPASRSRAAANEDAADATLDSNVKHDLYELADDPNATAASTPRAPGSPGNPGSTVQLDEDLIDEEEPATKSTVYITKDQADAQDREVAEEQERQRPFIIGGNTVLLIGFLILVAVLTKWYMSAPSADKLAARIQAAVKEDEPTDEQYLEAAELVRQLEQYHPDDPRLKQFDHIKTEAQLIDEAKKLRIQARRMYRRGAKSAIERSYLEAVAYIEVDAEVALNRLQALVDLYNEPTVLKDDEIRKYLTLALRQIDEMKEKAAAYSTEHVQLIHTRLARAEALKAEKPDEAAKIARAIIILYADKQWAQPQVDKARALLLSIKPP